MFIEETMTIFVEAVKELFDNEFPYADMRNLSVHVEYPLEPQSYPGLWVQVIPQGPMFNVGIGHVERVGNEEYYRWQFSGVVEITAAALSSLERARMLDWISKAIAFGHQDGESSLSDFRNHIEHNPYVGIRSLWESFTVGGFAETPGTPWGTDDVIYEGTVSLTIEGEVYFNPNLRTIVPLEQIVIEDRLSVETVVLDREAEADDGWR